MTLRFQGQGHGGNDLGLVGAKQVYFNFDDPRLKVLIPGYARFLTSFFLYDLEMSGSRSRLKIPWTVGRQAPIP